ncbi:MAG: hypothetical protein HXY20_14735 [Acidobacteria bacterium]|nr:hypothetical protein [Acidobacteriota bacterium]
MRKGLVFVMVALPLALVLPLLGKGVGSLPQPLDFIATLDGDVIHASWSAVEEAAKYSVDVIAFYGDDADEDGLPDQSMDFNFGTSDRDDGLGMDVPSLDIPVEEILVDADGDGNLDDYPVLWVLRVRALNPGRNAGRQNNPFSDIEIVYPE